MDRGHPGKYHATVLPDFDLLPCPCGVSPIAKCSGAFSKRVLDSPWNLLCGAKMKLGKRPFHLAWFISKGYGPKAGRQPWGGPNPSTWVKPGLFVELAQSLERAAFDYVIIEDSCNIPYTYQHSHDTYVRYAVDSPKLDPSVLAPFMFRRHHGSASSPRCRPPNIIRSCSRD